LSYGAYKNWIDDIYKIVKDEKPDVVHFLFDDVFYRFLGYGLHRFKKYNSVITVHSVRTGALAKVVLNIISRTCKKIVVHSQYMKNALEKMGVKNVCHIEYPVFNSKSCEKSVAREYFGLNKDVKTLGCIGGTRYDKGLDVLLDALGEVKEPFQLLIAGCEEDFKEDFIKEKISSYKDKVHLKLKFLSDEELTYAMNAIDVVVLPYRKWFNGASGPLGEGVALGKCVVGPTHGNLGDTITKNHLGYTFETENINALTDALKKALSEDFVIDEKYSEYKDSLDVEYFVNRYNELYRESDSDCCKKNH
jgi:glycosyltransferase involved in cell wall biosynthesis